MILHGVSQIGTLLLLLMMIPPAAGQPLERIFNEGLLAFEEERYDEATHLLRRVARKDRKHAEAHYLLARIYSETPPKNPFRAKEAIKKALALEPDEVRYLELRLRHYQEDSTNRAAYPEQLATRKSLAKSILNLDPNHPLALIEMGRVALDDYEWLVYADLFFGHPGSGVKGWHTERGQTFLRYGKPRNFPRAMVRYGPFKTEEFSAKMSVAMSRLVTWDYGDFVLQFEDMVRNGEYIYYDLSEIDARVMRRDVPERYEHQEPGRRTAFPYLASAFKGPAGQTDLYVPYGIPLESYDPAGPRLDLTLRTGAFLIRPTGEIISQRRSEFGLRTAQIAPFQENDLWIGLHALTAAPGPYDLSVEFETEDREALGYQRDPLFVPDFSAEALMLSDVLLAYGVEEADAAAEPGHIARGGLSIRPAPWGVFATEQPIYFYFEVYNLARNTADGATAYEVEAALTPWDDAGGLKKLLRGVFGQKKKGGVSLRFATTGTARDDGQYLILDAQSQPPGRYVLSLRVRDTVTGEWVEASREVFLE